MTERVRVAVGGVVLEGWESVRITSSLAEAASSFELPSTDADGQVLAKQAQVSRAHTFIRPDSPVTIAAGDDRLLTGYVDTVEPSYDIRTRSMAIEGRSKLSDAIECSVVVTTSRVFKGKLDAILAGWLRPYGIRLLVDTPTVGTIPKIKRFKLQRGEKVWAACDRLLRKYGLVGTDTVRGELLISRPSETTDRATDALVLGDNVVRASHRATSAEVYSEYVCKGQRVTSDGDSGAVAAHAAGVVTDDQVARYRRLEVLPEGRADAKRCEEICAYEAATRYGRALTYTAQVASWRQSDGELWRKGELVTLQDDVCGVAGEWLIVSVVYELTPRGGTIATLTCQPPEAWDLLEPPKKRKRKRKGRKASSRIWKDLNERPPPRSTGREAPRVF